MIFTATLPALSIFASVFLIWMTQKKFHSNYSKSLGLIVGTLGILVSLKNWPTSIADSKLSLVSSQWSIADFNSMTSKFSWKKGFISLPVAARENAKPVDNLVRLDTEANDIDDIIKSRNNGWIILDASHGLQERHRVWIENHFGKLQQLTEKNGHSYQNICWLRHPSFPFASGICDSRNVRFMLDPRNDDLARNDQGLATARIRELLDKQIILITHEFSPKEFSPEEGCLSALSRGEICLASETLPGSTMTAISLTSSSPAMELVLQEFGLTQGQALDRGLSVYRDSLFPGAKHFVASIHGARCGGVQKGKELQIADLNWLSEEWRNAKTHRALLKSLDLLKDQMRCPGIVEVQLAEPSLAEPSAAARTLMSSIRQNLLWITTASSFFYRSQKMARVQFATDDIHNKLIIKSLDSTKDASFTLISPASLKDETGMELKIDGQVPEWRVLNISSFALRVNFSELNGIVTLDFGQFIKSLLHPKLSLEMIAHTAGVTYSFLFAYIFAVIIACAQASSPLESVRKTWFLTLIVVLVIASILVFSSFHFARKQGGDKPSLLSIENLRTPMHLFQREWIESWFADLPQFSQTADLLEHSSSTDSDWEKALAEAREKSFKLSRGSSIPELVSKVTNQRVFRPQKKNSKKVIVWDQVIARNFYFHRSSIYEDALDGWQRLGSQQGVAWTIFRGLDLNKLPVDANTILIVPDLGFVTSNEIQILEKFVSEGGTLVFADRVGHEAGEREGSFLETRETGSFLSALVELGLGRTQFQYFNSLPDIGFPVAAINAPHVVADGKWIQGKVYKKGVILFLGLLPTESGIESVLQVLLQRMTTDSYRGVDLGSGCVSFLLLSPFGSLERQSYFAKRARQLGLQVKWYLDPTSFANMMATWKDLFEKDGVIFRDDGTVENRFLAELLWEHFSKIRGNVSEPLLFATDGDLTKFVSTGPKSVLFNLVPLTGVRNDNVTRWASECRTGLALPRFISPHLTTQDVEKLFWQFQSQIEILKPSLPLRDIFQTVEDSRNHPSSIWKDFHFQRENPLLFQ